MSAERLLAFESRAKLASIQVEAAHQIKVTSWQVQANGSLRVGAGKEPQSKATETSAADEGMVAAASASKSRSTEQETSKETQQLSLPEIDLAELEEIGYIGNGTRGRVGLFSWQDREIALKCPHGDEISFEEAQAFVNDEIESFEQLQKDGLCQGVVHAEGIVKIRPKLRPLITCLALEYVKGAGLNSKGKANIEKAASEKNPELEELVAGILQKLSETAACIKSKGLRAHDGNTGNVIIPENPDVLRQRGIVWIDMGTRGLPTVYDMSIRGFTSNRTSIDGNVAYFKKMLCEYQKLPCP